MADSETVTKRLLAFIDEVRQSASHIGHQRQVGQPSSPKSPSEQVYEKCFESLTGGERDEFDRMIEKMRGALIPLGAVWPP
jgi:hypothetical protein